MGKPLMVQERDDARICELRDALGAKTKIEVVRAALDLLEQEVARRRQIDQWRKAASLAAKSSAEVNVGFQAHSRIRRS